MVLIAWEYETLAQDGALLFLATEIIPNMAEGILELINLQGNDRDRIKGLIRLSSSLFLAEHWPRSRQGYLHSIRLYYISSWDL